MSKGILIIESDFEAARLMASALESEGYFVFTASTAESGMDMARRVKPSILFLSPSVEGLSENGVVEFIKDLRSQEASKDIPIMLVTEGDKEYDPRYGTMYGIINFIKKPVDPAEVLFKCRASIEDVPEKPKAPEPEVPEKILAANRETGFGYSEGGPQGGDGPEKRAAGEAGGETERYGEPQKSGGMENFEDLQGPQEGQPDAQAPAEPPDADPFEDILKGFKKEGADEMGPKWESEDQDFMPFGQPRKKRGLGMKILYVCLIVLAGAAVSFGVLRYMAVKRDAQVKKELKTAKVDNSPVIVQDTLPAPAASNSAVAPAAANTAAITPAANTVAENPQAANPVVNQITAKAAVPVATAQAKTPVKPAAQANKPQSIAQAGSKPVKKPEKTHIAKAIKAPKKEGGKFHSVQAGVFSSRANALKLEKRLKAKGYPAVISKTTTNRGRAAYRVLVGKYSNSAEAVKAEKKLRRQGFSAILK